MSKSEKEKILKLLAGCNDVSSVKERLAAEGIEADDSMANALFQESNGAIELKDDLAAITGGGGFRYENLHCDTCGKVTSHIALWNRSECTICGRVNPNSIKS